MCSGGVLQERGQTPFTHNAYVTQVVLCTYAHVTMRDVYVERPACVDVALVCVGSLCTKETNNK